MVLHPLDQGVDGLQAKAVLLAAVEAVGLVDEEDAPQGALDDAVGQGGGVAGVAAHQVPPADLHQLAAPQGADGLQIPGHQPGDGGLAGAGVAGKDHVHRQAGRLEAGGGPALLDPDIVRQAEHIFLDLVQAHQGVQLLPDLLGPAVPDGRQQVGQGGRGAAVHRKAEHPVPHLQSRRPGLEAVLPQAVFAQSPEDPLAAAGQRRRPQLAGVLAGHIVPDVLPGREGQLELAGAQPGQVVQQAGGQGLQAFGGEGPGLAHIPQGRHKPGPQQAGHLLPPLVGKEDQVLAPGGDPAHRAGGQGGAGVDQDALPVDQIPGGQGRRPFHRQAGQRPEKGGAAALVMVEQHHLPRAVQGGIEILQKELFGAGVRVKGQVHPGHLAALQQAPGGHPAGGLLQGKVAAGARRPPQQDHVARLLAVGPQHKGPAHGPNQGVHIVVLAQHRLLDLGGQPLEAAQLRRRDVRRALGQQAVGLHVPQQLAAFFQRLPCGGVLPPQGFVLLFQQLVQRLLLLQQGFVQVRSLGPGGGAGGLGGSRFGPGLFGRPGLLFGRAAGAHPPSRAEHTVHQAFPIVVVTHHGASLSISRGTGPAPLPGMRPARPRTPAGRCFETLPCLLSV